MKIVIKEALLKWEVPLCGDKIQQDMATCPKIRFANWTKIVFRYCDSGFHQGYRKNPVSYKGKNLYFRGSKKQEQIFRG